MVLRRSLFATLIIGICLVLGLLVSQRSDPGSRGLGGAEELGATRASAERRCPPTGQYGNPLPPSCSDIDEDGTIDAKDRDDDGDGIPDKRDPDRDGDGIPDRRDKDADNDGVNNGRDNDDDNDGVKDKKDKDDDADGVRDRRDQDHPLCVRNCK